MKEQEEVLIETKEKEEKVNFLVIHNDDVNSFDEVIDLLIRICNLGAIQAEQCMLIAHHKGKCDVKES